MTTDPQLADAAAQAAASAYCPYSGFHVGAAVLVADGRVFTGANVENASYGLTLCAERNALCAAVAAGARAFVAVAIAADGEIPTPPCGACRQVLVEFCGPDLRVVLAPLKDPSRMEIRRLGDLLPHAFNLKHTGKAQTP